MDLGRGHCVVCLVRFNGGLNSDNVVSEKSNTKEQRGFTDLWKTFLDLLQINQDHWSDLGKYFGDSNITPFCERCTKLISSVLIPSQAQQLIPATTISDKTKVLGATLIKTMIESDVENLQSNILFLPSVNTTHTTDSFLKTIEDRMSNLRQSKLQEFSPVALLRDCRCLAATLKYFIRRTDYQQVEVKQEPTESPLLRDPDEEENFLESCLEYTKVEDLGIKSEVIKKEETIIDEPSLEEDWQFGHTVEVPTTSTNDDRSLNRTKYYLYKPTSQGKRKKGKSGKRVKLPKDASPVLINVDSITCDLCDAKPFKRIYNLIRHIQKVHKRPVARLLNSVPPNKPKLDAGPTRHKGGELEYGGWKITRNESGGFSCVCGILNGDLRGIRSHIQTEHLAGRNPDQFPVQGGGEKSTSLGDGKFVYAGDWVFQKLEDGRFECFTCRVQKPCKKAMVEHLRTKHTPAACRFYCKLCNVGFTSRSYFLRHSKRHKKQRWWNVDKDTYVYDDKFEFKRVDKGFQCGTCGIVLKEFFFMTQHTRDVHSNPSLATCSRCGKGFTHRRHCWKHMRLGTCAKREFRLSSDGGRMIYREKFEIDIFRTGELKGEERKVRYRCVTCGQERNSRSALFRHIRLRHCENQAQ